MAELAKCATVAGGVAFTLSLPVASVLHGCPAAVAAGVQVPEAAVHVDDLSELGKNDVGGAWQVAAVEAEAITEPVNQAADDEFWLGIFRANGCHDPRALGLSELIRHVIRRRCPDFGSRAACRYAHPVASIFNRMGGIMASQQAGEAIRADFLEWSGGFPPDSAEQVTVYVDYAAPGDAEPAFVREVLMAWMREEAVAD